MLSEAVNHTGYLYNGFDDLAANGEAPGTVPLNRLPTPSQVLLLGPKTQGATGFYADRLLQPLTDLFSQFNPAVYDGGAHYLFVDGSVRFLKQSEYSNNLWLNDKTIQLPPAGRRWRVRGRCRRAMPVEDARVDEPEQGVEQQKDQERPPARRPARAQAVVGG